MADFEGIIRKHVGDDGNIPSAAINAIVTAIRTAVGNEYVDKERYKAKLTEIDTLKEQAQDAKDSATTAEKWKAKYDAIKADFDDFKTAQTAKETKGKKVDAYKALLEENGVLDKYIKTVLRASDADIDALELDKDGKIKNAEQVVESIKKDWADFIGSESKTGANESNPPENNPAKPVFNSRVTELAKQFSESRYGIADQKGE